jgi:hypothetical protein
MNDFGVKNVNFSFQDVGNNPDEKTTFIKAAIDFMENVKEPKSSKEIWAEIKDDVETSGDTPEATLTSTLLAHSDNSTLKRKAKIKYFTIIDNNPQKFWLISRLDELNRKIKKPIDFMEDSPSQSKENPFGGVKGTSAICILGESGVGKSYRVEKTLERAGHEYEYIMPSAFTTNLLVQYKAGSGYVLNTLGRIIIEANNNPDKLYTIFFDECHKYINLINDEILQALSKKRNDGVRYITLDIETDQFFHQLPKKNGRRIIPDNLGFILASSKEEIVRENPDLKNRVDYITLTESDKEDNIDFAVDFLIRKIEKESTNEGFSF